MQKITDLIRNQRVYFDGGFGSMLQKRGLKSGEAPELWNVTHPDVIADIHREYLLAGCDILTTNTFGINCLKYDNYSELIKAAFDCAKAAKKDFENKFIGFDIGPSGKLLKPYGDLDFENAVEIFAKNVKEAVKNGADFVIIETMNDSYETKAAVLAVKENSDLPVFVTNVYDETKKLMTGASPQAMCALLEGLGVDAIGVNCSLGPDKLVSVVNDLSKVSSVPIIANPNAGLPSVENGKTVYTMGADEFSDYMISLAQNGADILGGCCGTTPEYIKKTIEKTKGIPLCNPSDKKLTMVSSYTHSVQVGTRPVLIGERINPTGKKKFKEALKSNDIGYILSEGIRQAEKGVHILDVNVGLPEIDETQMLKNCIYELQAVCDLPLQIDTADPVALEQAMRIYNGKPLVNSVNGKQSSMDSVFPLIKKYGGVVVALTLDENGIPDTPSGRVKIAERIISEAEKYNISAENIIVDPLALAVSSDSNSANITLETISLLHKKGIKTGLGVSNISFGLPIREKINSVFFAMALENGLNCAIMNPFSVGMTDAYYAFCALKGIDTACSEYISYADGKTEVSSAQNEEASLEKCIIKGLVSDAEKITAELLKIEKPIEIINNHIIPALNAVGKDFESGKAYLPQLLMSADTASSAFSKVKEKMPTRQSNGKKIILATVFGDIHDIGKNIVKVLLESYGFEVIDLGKDVEPNAVLDAVKSNDCSLVGLSALMTTTVVAMEQTVKLLHEYDKSIKTIVGGAVLNKEYADMIGADFYSPDAMDTVRYAQEFYK